MSLQSRERAIQNFHPLFRLHGGPGFPGLGDPSIEYLENNVWPITRELGADYVVVGQRGIGSSKPNTLIAPVAGFEPSKKYNLEQFRRAVRTACQEGRQFWESAGLDLAGINVAEAAADVNDVRAALGYQTMMLSGTSFGSHWAMAVMRYHPRVVERAVISGLEGPDHTWDVPSHVLNTLERIATAAEQHEALAALIPEAGLLAALEVVLRRLHDDPVLWEVVDPETGDLRTAHLDALAIQNQLLSRMSSGYGIREWPAKILTLYHGNYEAAALAHLRDSAPWTNATASFFLIDCASGVSRRRREKIERDGAVATLGRINEAYRAAASVWNVDLGESFRQDFETDIPTLLVQGTWDVNTPLENAEELVPLFKQGKLILVERGSHAALREANGTSKAFHDGFLEFLRTGSASKVPHTVQLPPVQWRIPDKPSAAAAKPKAKQPQSE